MKRSEMIELLQTRLNVPLDEAENVLNVVEGLGMKPALLPDEYCQAITSVYIAGCSRYQWEEDIEKDDAVMKALHKRRERNK